MRKLITVPNKILRVEARPAVLPKDEDLLRELRRDLSRVIRQNKALGLTACQIGTSIKFFIIDQNKLKGAKKFNYFINAEVEGIGSKEDNDEGCLSIPGKRYTVKRYHKISVKSLMFNGMTRKRVFTGLTAFCIQHEFDHTEGKLISSHGKLI